MPTKVLFRVIHVSGQDENHKAVELNAHSPTTKGWQSNRFCLYPQDIVIRLEKRSRLRKLQILSHQNLIATKIEFYVGDVPDGTPENLQNARYTRLGYVALSDNEKTAYKARELKSVHVDAMGVFIKFVIHKNHVNRHNLYNQVGLVALNVIGDFVNHENVPEVIDPRIAADPSLAGVYNRPDYISPLDDLAFDMYQDPEVAQIIRKLEVKKQESVLQERYDYAKRVKAAIIDLQKVGEKLGKYEVEKRQAVESEDFDKAKLKKLQMDEYRLQIYKQLEIHDMLEVSGSRQPKPVIVEPSRQPTPPRLEALEETPVYSTRSPPRTPLDERPLPAIKRPTTPPDERPLPSISNRNENEVINPDDRPLPATQRGAGAPEDDVTDDVVTGEPEAMNDKDQREASLAIDVFGYELVKKAYSKTWSFREDALLEVLKILQELPDDTSRDDIKNYYRAAILLAAKGLKDKVQAVYTAAITLITYLLNDFAPEHKLGKMEMTHGVERTLPSMITRTADTGFRSRDSFKKLIIEVSSFPEVKPLMLVPHECVKPFKLNAAPRLALSRTELVELLYLEHGLANSGLTVENIMNFCTIAIKHNNGEVREKAERIIVALYKECGAIVKKFLPTDDQKTRKNVLYKQLFEAFDKLDGKPSKEELRRQRAEEAAAKQAQVEALEKQVQDLRNMASKATPKSKAKEPPPKKKEKKKKPEPPPPDDSNTIDRKSSAPSPSTCIFCGEKNEAFTEEGLDVHYWKSCPMLKRCAQCKQVVEISGLTEHLLRECDNKDIFKQCKICGEAIPKAEHEAHVEDPEHNRKFGVTDNDKSHCPMCHTNIPLGDDSWRIHLMTKDPSACKNNPRRLVFLNKPADGKSKVKTKGDKSNRQ